jgi:hypothetical protein
MRSHKGAGVATQVPKAVKDNATEEGPKNEDVTHTAQYSIDLDVPDESNVPRSDLVQCLAEFDATFRG